jgi:predicted nucleotidyltransferase
MLEIERYKDEIALICRKYGIARLEVFGSAVTDEFRRDSDVDILIDFADEGGSLFHRYFDLKYDLEHLFGREVDVVIAKAMKNPYFIEEVEETKQLVYAAQTQ